jgi:GrpB-like predicted nucleotidyltransferase (UPF0157 family)
MLTKQQKDWLNHLSDTHKVEIVPYDPRVKKIFQQIKAELEQVLDGDSVILHKGASAWGISGKGDVDIYIPVPVEQFNNYFKRLKTLLGEPGSYYDKERVRWNKQSDDIEVEIFLVNKDAEFYKDSELFWDYIETHPGVLEEYRKIKEEAEGTSTREYYTRKVIFINKVMESIKNANK